MFGKLLKYDFRSMFKQFAFIWPAALVLALVNHFTLNGSMSAGDSTARELGGATSISETTAAIAMLVFVAILMAMFIIAVIFVIQRFYKGLLGDEGYLMFTLPVRPWQLIGSKLLCAVLTTFINVVVAILSIFIIFPWESEDFKQLFTGLRWLLSHWDMQMTNAVIGLLEFALFMLTSFATAYLLLYLSMSIGHLFNKNRVAMSVIAFIALDVIINTLSGMGLFHIDFNQLTGNLTGIALYHRTIWLLIAGELVLSAIYFAGTEFILRKKLNLE